jgi:hypothetical protein
MSGIKAAVLAGCVNVRLRLTDLKVGMKAPELSQEIAQPSEHVSTTSSEEAISRRSQIWLPINKRDKRNEKNHMAKIAIRLIRFSQSGRSESAGTI